MKRLILFVMFIPSVTLLTACANQGQQYQRSQPINSSQNNLEQRCNSLRFSVMGQTKSKYWYDSVNAGTEAYERCMMGMPPAERPKPTTTDCQRVGFDDFRCTTK